MTDTPTPDARLGDDAEIIEVPNSMRDKVRISDGGEVSELFRAAEQAIAEQGRDYLGYVAQDHTALRAALDGAIGDPARRSDDLNRIFGLVHNMKGQGKSFGYDMITTIAGSLCEFLRKGDGDTSDRAMQIVKAHVDAIGVVIDHRLKGDGGPLGRKLVGRLQGLVAAHSG